MLDEDVGLANALVGARAAKLATLPVLPVAAPVAVTAEAPAQKPQRKKAKPRTKGSVAEADSEAEAAKKSTPTRRRRVKVVEDDRVDLAPDKDLEEKGGEEYVDQDSEWEDTRYGGQEEHPTASVLRDFTGGEKGISGKTDLTKWQMPFLWTLRNLQMDFAERGMHDIAGEIEEGAKWFETYRLSIDRKSRVESVDILRGKLEMTARPDEANASPLRFN